MLSQQNPEVFVQTVIDSVYKQSLDSVELIIIDDASSDNTLSIIRVNDN